ncbi:MAG: hypothetical protein A2Y76_11950 [Planctomycetes bacterium RBG_13_60_9]|nr:MAG: hypothetical protein A2Y76_11950 [Planctomycetes bacterium RBG_13_60_9]
MESKDDILASTVFQVPDNLTWRDVDHQTVVLNLTSGEYVTFNDVGRQIWLSVTEGKDVGQIAKQVSEEYDISEEQAVEDTKEFLSGLIENHMLLVGVA